MEQLVLPKLNTVPVPTPCENYSFLVGDDSFLAVTPEKSSRILPMTELLKEGSFLDEDGEANRSKVQFNKSVSVFHFSPDQSSNVDTSHDSSFHDDVDFDSSSCEQFSENSQNRRIENLMKKIDKIDARVRRHYSDGRQSIHASHNPTNHRSDPDDDPSSSRLKSVADTSLESELLSSPMIIDVRSHDDEIPWGDEDDDDDCYENESQSSHQSDNNSFTKENCTDSIGPENSDEPRRFLKEIQQSKLGVVSTSDEILEKSNSIERDKIARPQKNKLDFQRTKNVREFVSEVNHEQVVTNVSHLLSKPSVNTTSKYCADVETLKRQSYEAEVSRRGSTGDSELKARIKGKALSRLNIPDTNQYTNLVSVEVDEEEICQKVIKDKMSKVKREKVIRVEDKITRLPEVMDFYNENYFIREPPCSPSKTPKTFFRSFKPKVKSADLERASDLYRHNRMWEELS